MASFMYTIKVPVGLHARHAAIIVKVAKAYESEVTVSLNGEFVGPAAVGDLVEATGEVVKAGGSLLFVRGLISTGGRPMLNFSGVVKKIRPR